MKIRVMLWRLRDVWSPFLDWPSLAPSSLLLLLCPQCRSLLRVLEKQTCKAALLWLSQIYSLPLTKMNLLKACVLVFQSHPCTYCIFVPLSSLFPHLFILLELLLFRFPRYFLFFKRLFFRTALDLQEKCEDSTEFSQTWFPTLSTSYIMWYISQQLMSQY